MYFSIAQQSVTLPGGNVLGFRVNPVDTSLVEIHMAGRGPDGAEGTHILTFKRNGGPADVVFAAKPQPDLRTPNVQSDIPGTPVPAPPLPPVPMTDPLDAPFTETKPLAGLKSVDDDAVRGDPIVPPKPQLAGEQDKATTSNSF